MSNLVQSFTRNALIYTARGPQRMDTLAGHSRMGAAHTHTLLCLNEANGELDRVPLLWAGEVARKQQVIQLRILNEVLELTPEQQVYTLNRGLVLTENLRPDDEIAYLDQHDHLNTTNEFSVHEGRDDFYLFSVVTASPRLLFANRVLVSSS